MDRRKLFCSADDIDREKYIIATYFLQLDPQRDVLARAADFAVGQSIGTWVELPGVTEALERDHLGKVVEVIDVPPCELNSQNAAGDSMSYVIRIAFPIGNFGPHFSMLLTTLLGNDASTSAQAKLMDISFPKAYAKAFGGPSFGIAGLRELTGVYDRPLLLNMIKPCTGLSPEEGAKVFYETALGGVDMIKDDELLGADTSFSTACGRVTAFQKAAQAAYEKTGKKAIYVVNVTCDSLHMLTMAERAVELGAQALMVNFVNVGYGMMRELADRAGVPILAHYAGCGMLCEGTHSGMASPLALGKLPRLAGADAVVMNTPYGGYPLRRQKYLQTIDCLTQPYHDLRPSMPVVGGKLHPGTVGKYVQELGQDIILGAGGSIQGHPGGITAGARAMLQAIEAAAAGIPANTYALTRPELRQALELWGTE